MQILEAESSRPRPKSFETETEMRRDLRPSRPRPRLQKTHLETRLETESKSRDSITANNSDRKFDMHYIELYIFALELYLNSLNHIIWKRLKVTVCGRLPLSRYVNTWLDHDDVSIGLYCTFLAPQ